MPDLLEPLAPNDEDRRRARESRRRLLPYLADPQGLRVRIEGAAGAGQTLEIPASALHLLASILSEMAEGNPITLLPVHAEMTTQQAADFLGVSRPFLVRLLEDAVLPFRKVGTHRRLLLRDVLAYKQQSDDKRQEALRELAALSQELNMGY